MQLIEKNLLSTTPSWVVCINDDLFSASESNVFTLPSINHMLSPRFIKIFIQDGKGQKLSEKVKAN